MSRFSRRAVLFTCVLSTWIISSAQAGTWATYLADNARTGGSDAKLSTPLQLRWVYSSPAPPEKAWSGPRNTPIEGNEMRHRVAFDDAIHVVIADDLAFFGSSVDHKLYCVDLKSGKPHWTFFTGGPIRLAPTYAAGKVYVGSDDGSVYCLNAADGRLVWKLQVAGRDEQLLARGRMISRWPVRTSVLVDDGVAFFGAGVFPHETVYLCAAEANTGKIIWRNDAISQQDAGRNDLSPQGYLLCNDEMVFVPSGRSLPVAFDRKTGKIVHHRKHHWRAHADVVVGGAKALLADGQVYAAGPHHFLAMDQKTGEVGYAWIAGRQMAVCGDRAYIATGEIIAGLDRPKHTKASVPRQKLNLQRSKYRSDRKRLAEIDKQMAEYARTGLLWNVKHTGDAALIQAGGLIFVGGQDEVLALEADSGKQLWKTSVEGRARGLAVVDDTLVVSTDLGKIYRFASAGKAPDDATVAKYPATKTGSPFPQDNLTPVYQKAAKDILARSKQSDGFCLIVGSENGRLAYELAKQSNLRIYGIESDAAKFAASREALDRAGLFGSRVTIVNASAESVPFSRYFANLIVSDTLLLTGKLPAEATDLAGFLKPCGGVVCIGVPSDAPAAAQNTTVASLKDTLGRMYINESPQIETNGRWATLVRGKLPGAGDWSHQYGNVANTSLSNDHRLKGGLGVLWYGDPGPSQMINRHQAASAPLSTNGRMFIQGTDSIRAYDAYNGRYLWEYKNPGAIRIGVFNNQETNNLAASDDALFVAVGDTCTILDAATGKIRAEHKTPKSADGIERAWGYIAYDNGVLFGTSTIRSELARSLRRRGRVIKSDTDAIFAVDAKTGKRLWTYRGKNILHVTIAIGDGRVFFVDASLSKQQREDLLREDKTALKQLSGKARDEAEVEIKRRDLRLAVAIDARTGKKLWEKSVDVTDCTNVSAGGGSLCMMYQDGHLVLCGANANGHYWGQFLSGQFSRRRLVVLDADTGEKIWAKDANYMNRPLVVGQEIIAEPWAFELHTGKEKTRIHPLTGEEIKWQFSRPGHYCGIITATPNMMFFRSGFIGYYDLCEDSGTKHFAGQRLGCWINAIPAGGVLVIPEASAGCVCLFSIASTLVMEPRGDRTAWGLYSTGGGRMPVKHMALNLGAPGDRRDKNGRIWFGYPRPRADNKLEFLLDIKPQFHPGGRFEAGNAESVAVEGADNPWVFASGARGLSRCEIPLLEKGQTGSYTVKLLFADVESGGGDRTFAVKLQGVAVAKDVDVAKLAGGSNKALVRRFEDVSVTGNLTVELTPNAKDASPGQLPNLVGIEIERQ